MSVEKFIIILFLLLSGANCFGTAEPFPGREITIQLKPVAFVNVLSRPYPILNQATSTPYEHLLMDAAGRTEDNNGVSPGIRFNHVPFRWGLGITSSETDPQTEAHLKNLFTNEEYIGPLERPLRTLSVMFVKSLPGAPALTSGAYRRGSYEGVTWIYEVVQRHKVLFALNASPQSSLDNGTFATAFRLYFLERHGAADGSIPTLRASLLSPNGVGCYEAEWTSCVKTKLGTGQNVRHIMTVGVKDLIPDRCYQLMWSSDLVEWKESWFGTINNPANVATRSHDFGNLENGFLMWRLCPTK